MAIAAGQSEQPELMRPESFVLQDWDRALVELRLAPMDLAGIGLNWIHH